jgi:hypothetical protein
MNERRRSDTLSASKRRQRWLHHTVDEMVDVGLVNAGLHPGKVSMRALKGRGDKYTATIGVGGSRFYDPSCALSKAMDEALKMPAPSKVKELDPCKVTSTAIQDAHRGCSFMRSETSHLRMHRMVGEERWITCWKDKQAGFFAWFYLFSDRLLWQAWTPAEGWINRRVPEEGLPSPRSQLLQGGSP